MSMRTALPRFAIPLRFSALGGGLALLVLSLAGWFPGIGLAAAFADADGLSETYAQMLRVSQWRLAFALLAGGAGVELWMLAARRGGALRIGAAIRRPVLLIAAAGFLGAAAVQAGLFDNIPHITDATSHWFQARIFATGRLSAEAPPCPAAFFQHNVVVGAAGQWHTKYFPGHALWLLWPLRLAMMPLAFALFLAAAHRIAAHYFGRPAAHVSAALLATSPLLLLLGGSFMSHTTLLMWMAGGWAFLLNAIRPGAPVRGGACAAAAGFCGGMGLLTRPQDAVVAGVLIGAATLPRLIRAREAWIRNALGLVVGAALPLGFLLIWNHHLYGDLLATGYHLAGGPARSQTPIIRDAIGLSADFPWTRALAQSLWTGLRLNQALLGWPAALPLLLPALLLPAIRRGNGICLLGAAAMYLPYAFFHYYGFELEARYAAAAAPFLIVMVARTLIALFRAAGAIPAGRPALAAWIAAFVLYAGGYYWPAYLVPRYAGAYEEASPAIHQAAQTAGLDTPALVLLPNAGFVYSSGFIHTDPDLAVPIVYARDIPGELACLRESFPHRTFYRWEPPAPGQSRARLAPVPP